jgi:hypothetical protein
MTIQLIPDQLNIVKFPKKEKNHLHIEVLLDMKSEIISFAENEKLRLFVNLL